MQLQLLQTHQTDLQNTESGLSSTLSMLQTLLYIIEQFNLNSGSWRATAAFVDYFYTPQEKSVHPLKDIYNWLQVRQNL